MSFYCDRPDVVECIDNCLQQCRKRVDINQKEAAISQYTIYIMLTNNLHSIIAVNMIKFTNALSSSLVFKWGGALCTVSYTPWMSCPSGPSWAESLPPDVWSHSRRNNGTDVCYIWRSWSAGTPGHRTHGGLLRGDPRAGRTPIEKEDELPPKVSRAGELCDHELHL